MFEKNLKLAYLIDFYGDVLDEHTRSVMYSYYEDDLSLSEIAEGLGISRQGVRHIIKRGEEQLEFLESRLGLAKKHDELKADAKELLEISNVLSLCEQKEISDIGARLAKMAALIADDINET